MAIKAIELVQAKQQRVTASQKAVETKELTLRLAGEQFGISKTAVYWKYAKFGVGIPAVGAVLDEVQKKASYGLANCCMKTLVG